MAKKIDGRRNNGGNKNAGRKSKAEELKVVKLGLNAIVKVYGSIEAYYEHIAKESKTSFPHMKLLQEYVFGKPKESIEVSNVDNIKPPTIVFHGRDKDK